MKKYWLVKSEPDNFSIDDLKKCKNQTTFWDGVTKLPGKKLLTR